MNNYGYTQGWEESRDNLDRDESMAYFDSESVSKETLMGIVGVNDTFSRTTDSLRVSIRLDRHQDCLGVDLERDIDLCRAQPC